MENNAQRIKSISSAEMDSIEELKNHLNQKAANPPQIDIFTLEGRLAWRDWSEGGREIERQLEAEGVKL
ncbi:MAG: hypothetical protein C3F06_14445 [Candidatus Methanoperedenaceae archaeon]|nr:MAG: hypothetical protein C3F06_14445 [Candidatus Methanoperedenaceae archaeon]